MIDVVFPFGKVSAKLCIRAVRSPVVRAMAPVAAPPVAPPSPPSCAKAAARSSSVSPSPKGTWGFGWGTFCVPSLPSSSWLRG